MLSLSETEIKKLGGVGSKLLEPSKKFSKIEIFRPQQKSIETISKLLYLINSEKLSWNNRWYLYFKIRPRKSEKLHFTGYALGNLNFDFEAENSASNPVFNDSQSFPRILKENSQRRLRTA